MHLRSTCMHIHILWSVLLVSCALQVSSYTCSARVSRSGDIVLSAEKDNKGGRAIAGEDIIGRLFGAFLPKPEDIGLSRFDSNSLPENYPATKVIVFVGLLTHLRVPYINIHVTTFT